MRSSQTLVLLASLALLLGARAVNATCSAETRCVATGCGEAYGIPATDFPYSVDYTTTGDSLSTTFRIKVCSIACEASDPLCKPLKGFRLRLADDVLASPYKYIKIATPTGTVSDSCTPLGPGWLISGANLLSLASDPATGETCEVFSVRMYNPPGAMEPMPLSQLCQQDVEVVDQAGAAVFTQDGPSCLFTMELASGVSGTRQLDQRSPASPPSSPSPYPSPSPMLVPSPSPKPIPSPSPRPQPYYGGAHRRRLQQAPFMRSLLTSYYGPSAHRRREGFEGVAEPLAFATRRLMEASAVPLPHLLSYRRSVFSAVPAGRTLSTYYGSHHHLSTYHGSSHRLLQSTSSGRQLNSYYAGPHRWLHSLESAIGRSLLHGYYYGGHRRSLMSIGEEAAIGRSLLHGYYYGGHRRSLMSIGEEAAIGRSLLHGYYYGGHHRSLMSVGEESAIGRSLLHGGYYGDLRSSLLHGGYNGSHRRSLMSVGKEGAIGRSLLHGGYYHRRPQAAHRTLSSYYGKH